MKTYTNTFKIANAEFFSSKMMDKMRELDDLIDRYYHYLNLADDLIEYENTKISFNVVDLKIKCYKADILEMIANIQVDYDIKFNHKAITKLLYPYELI